MITGEVRCDDVSMGGVWLSVQVWGWGWWVQEQCSEWMCRHNNQVGGSVEKRGDSWHLPIHREQHMAGVLTCRSLLSPKTQLSTFPSSAANGSTKHVHDSYGLSPQCHCNISHLIKMSCKTLHTLVWCSAIQLNVTITHLVTCTTLCLLSKNGTWKFVHYCLLYC